MIALADSEKRAFMEVFPVQCLKSTPDPEFLSNLYGLDMSLGLLPIGQLVSKHYIIEIFRNIFDVFNSASRVPELLVWMQSQVRPTIIVPFILNDFHYTSIETP